MIIPGNYHFICDVCRTTFCKHGRELPSGWMNITTELVFGVPEEGNGCKGKNWAILCSPDCLIKWVEKEKENWELNRGTVGRR